MNGERKDHKIYQADVDEYSDQMMSPFRLLHMSGVHWKVNKYSGYAILVKKDDKAQVLITLTGNKKEKKELVGMFNSLEKLVRVEHSLATGKGFTYKVSMTDEQIGQYKSESERIRDKFAKIGIILP